MTVAYEVIQDSIRDMILEAGSNSNVIFYYPNAPQPAKPYTSIQLLSNFGEIHDWYNLNKETELLEIYGCREMEFTINCYGDNAFDEVNRIQGNSRKESVRQTLYKRAGMTIWRMSATRDLTDLVDDAFIQRMSFDITFNIYLEDGSTTDDVGVFDKVGPIDGTIIDP